MFEQLATSEPRAGVAPSRSTENIAKRHGVHYTPSGLATFVAKRVVAQLEKRENIILDPACGDGELLVAVAREAQRSGLPAPGLVGVDRDPDAIAVAHARLHDARAAEVTLRTSDFLMESEVDSESAYDAIVSNPPYVRTQVLGAAHAQTLARQFALTGRVDLYQAFVAAMTGRLAVDGVLGLLCSNRFLTTRAGESLRRLLLAHYGLVELWDLGDTKLFDAAVLPAVLVAHRVPVASGTDAEFVRVYENDAESHAGGAEQDLLTALENGQAGVVRSSGRSFTIDRGRLVEPPAGRPWRLTTSDSSHWLAEVAKRSAGRLTDLGRIRVGVKTTADAVFIRASWDDLPAELSPESTLLFPLLTHRVASRWSATDATADARTILYPHEMRDGKRRPVDLAQFPRAAAYLETHRDRLEGRDYVRKAGRAWYEIWVPQKPAAWTGQKLVWPDISDRPRFFLDTTGSIVNGDCYWLSCPEAHDADVALALAVANSSFATRFYDLCSGNRLYAGRRRFITQYLEELPIPKVTSTELQDIESTVAELRNARCSDTETVSRLEKHIDTAVAELFGVKEIAG